MKIGIFIILLIIQYSCGEKIRKTDDKARDVLIHMNFEKETIFSLTCDNFNQMSDLDSVYISDNEIDSVKLYSERFLLDTTSYIDVRGKIIFFINHKKLEYCFDRFGVFNRDGKFFKNQDLFDYIKKKLKETN